MYVLRLFTIFSGGSVGRNDEEEEAQQQSHGGISDVAGVTAQDKNRRSWSTDSWVSSYSKYKTLIRETSGNIWSLWGFYLAGGNSESWWPQLQWIKIKSECDSLREERSPARHETWRSGQPQQHHRQENSPSEHLLRAGGQKKGERMNEWMSNERMGEQTKRLNCSKLEERNLRQNNTHTHTHRLFTEQIPQLLLSINN